MTATNGITVYSAEPEDVWPNGMCPYPPAVVDEIFRVARALKSEEVRKALPGSELAPWYQPYVVAESMVINGAKKAGGVQAQTIQRLQAEVGQLKSELAAVRKHLRILVRSDGDLTDLIPEALGGMARAVRKDMGTEIAKTQAEIKAWTQERLGVLDQRINSLPSPRDGLPGVPGPAGRDGVPGAPGIDGLGLEDFRVEHDGERRVTFKLANGEREKKSQIVMPIQIYREVYKEGKIYEKGDAVTHGGSIWAALVGTSEKPGQGCKDWRLAVKAGRDGRDGKSAYDIAVEKGFKGSETEWLKTLRGPEGKPGRDLTFGSQK